MRRSRRPVELNGPRTSALSLLVTAPEALWDVVSDLVYSPRPSTVDRPTGIDPKAGER
ncbi:hypothetical protein FB465_5681 [Kitasatospora atroaurantiaca]|uniref:Uncharacterized protein n=1 Tax=Kitasatospora atroaurantiaca TaxID=285545 RepID=A0A561EY65_9ACTN|nr:hypothetical protein FB465_5681 [Kitasatospora atroaurantiaca]